MAKVKHRAPSNQRKVSSTDGLSQALAKQKKDELIDIILEIARDDRGMTRKLERQLGVELAPSDLVAATRQAISDATAFDAREMNHNFDYDYQAYATVKANFGRLIKLGLLPDAMELSLELMKRGSYQVEMSDEGMMTDDIEECLLVVINALKKSKLPPTDVNQWCAAMTKADRDGVICRSELALLRAKLLHALSR